MMASGSDDAKVKLWSLLSDRSVGSIDAKVNVCCVYFSPTSRHSLVFGSAGEGHLHIALKFFYVIDVTSAFRVCFLN
ncbi:unnamed protein product [Anisakis simplex]|uniref:Uncharacterized protein n=1 Tax=Anisakis simplex TaxID=6269 RepID=A0A3P6QU74_ANISI|nr:unnamed protein product [Anisakis simplex]